MSLLQREKLVLLARKYDALIVTDDVYDFLQWSGGEGVDEKNETDEKDGKNEAKAPVMRLVDVDRTLEPVPGADDFGNAVSNGSFSKIVGPGMFFLLSPPLAFFLSTRRLQKHWVVQVHGV